MSVPGTAAPPQEPARVDEPALRVDCVIPTHDRPHLLAEALESVAGQTCPPHRVVVVADVDHPRTAEVVQRFRARHPGLECHYFVRSGPPGASASRNRGAREGTAEVLAFLDDDDLWEPHYLATALERLHARPVEAVVTTLRRFSASGDGALLSPTAGMTARDVFRSSPGVTGSSLVLRRRAFEAVGGFDEDLPVQNDRDLFLRLVAAGTRYDVVAEPLVRLRHHDSGRLTDPSPLRADGVLRFLDKHGPDFSPWDRRVLRYLSHRTQLSASRSWRPLVVSTVGAVANWSPTAARQVPLGLFDRSHLVSALRRVSRLERRPVR